MYVVVVAELMQLVSQMSWRWGARQTQEGLETVDPLLDAFFPTPHPPK